MKSERPLDAVYFKTESGNESVREWLKGLPNICKTYEQQKTSRKQLSGLPGKGRHTRRGRNEGAEAGDMPPTGALAQRKSTDQVGNGFADENEPGGGGSIVGCIQSFTHLDHIGKGGASFGSEDND